MPGIVSFRKSRTLKRKRGILAAPSTSLTSSTTITQEDFMHKDPALEVSDLEKQILKSRQYYNNISTLLDYVRLSKENRPVYHEAVLALCRIFSRLMAEGNMTVPQQVDKNESRIVKWLRSRCQEFCGNLLDSLATGTDEERSSSLTVLMQLFKEDNIGQKSDENLTWKKGNFPSIVQAIANTTTSNRIRETFIEGYVEQCSDVKFYTLKALAGIVSTINNSAKLDRIISTLIAVNSVDTCEERIAPLYINPPKKNHKAYSCAAQKRAAQDAWMAVLKCSLTDVQRKVLLRAMPQQIAPIFIKPEMLMDFLTDSFKVGGSVSLMALSGLFYLMQEKNLDYPQFYKKLYSLLDFHVLHSKHRSRFFRLLETFLASTHLPAILVASFIKRLSRLCLGAPPSAIVVVVPWIYNMFKIHPSCTFMIHRDGDTTDGTAGATAADPSDRFHMDEDDPMLTGAIESSLWEIDTLQSHYHPNVAAVAKIISEQFTKQEYNVEDFLDHTYGSMLDTELAHNMKKSPVVEYEIPKRIFVANKGETTQSQNLVAQLWGFGA
ncbi:hypothetical protein MMC11_008255 [Xylographa trunciseda]|nr:hypothetical protein [Xylographa trunciseda]